MRLIGLYLMWASFALRAQDLPVFRAESSLVQVRFHVTLKDRYVTDLKAADVILLEDGMPRPFSIFQNAITGISRTPVEIILLFDTSGSVMEEGLLNPLAFKESLLDTLGNARIAVYGFDTRVRRYTAPTRDYARLSAAFAGLHNPKGEATYIDLQLPEKMRANLRGGTWLYESIGAVARDAAANPADVTRFILVFSDGFPSTRTRPEFAAGIATELGMPVYPVILGHHRLIEQFNALLATQRPNQPAPSGIMTLQAKEREIEDFASLAELTGGRSFDPLMISLNMMRQVLGNIEAQVRTEYTVGFSPDTGTPPHKHRLEVRLREKDLGKVRGGTRTVVH